MEARARAGVLHEIAKLVHAENVGGDIDKVSNQRAWIGAYPLRGIEMESAMCRIVAMLPPA